MLKAMPQILLKTFLVLENCLKIFDIKRYDTINFSFITFAFHNAAMESESSMASDAPQEPQVILVSNDKEGEAKFSISRKAVELSITIKNLLQEMPDDEDGVSEIPLPNVTASVLERVVEYIKREHSDPDVEYDKRTPNENRCAEIREVDKEFCGKLNMEGLFNLILAANYLDIKKLLDLTCKTVAHMIKGKTPEEIKSLFGVTREFTPEEEEQVKRENPWLVETK